MNVYNPETGEYEPQMLNKYTGKFEEKNNVVINPLNKKDLDNIINNEIKIKKTILMRII